jgi:hypothetical protein
MAATTHNIVVFGGDHCGPEVSVLFHCVSEGVIEIGTWD